MQAPNNNHSARNPGQRVRRPRAARACDYCRQKKYKCDESYPCSYCKGRGVECVYKGQDMSRLRVTPDYVRKLEAQVKELSSRIEAYGIAGAASIGGKPAGTNSGTSTLDHEPTQPGINRDDPAMRSSTSPWETGQQEVSGVNSHTRGVEFYGSSSSVALLSHVQRTGDEPEGDVSSLLSTLHNPAFSPADPQTARESHREIDYPASSNWFPQCRGFLEAFFTTIHYVHPILDKHIFLQRCESLWSGNEADGQQLSSFTALYLSVLSLGALVGTRDDEPIDGIDNMQWSRKFFEKAKSCCNQIGMVTDLEMTQCYFILAKVCQNELHPHRYHNLRILLFGSFLLRSTPRDRASTPGSQEGVQKCLDSAKQTIDLIYQTYQHSDFFRTWFYNVTYTVFAASIILIYLAQEAIPTEAQPLLRLIDMAIEILLIMDECAFALEAAKLLRRAKEKAEARAMATDAATMEPLFSGVDGTVHLNHYWGPLNLYGDIDPNLAFSFLGFDEANPLLGSSSNGRLDCPYEVR
ncbi:putative transcriptional regulatory protein [Penicillium chrysogenum]|uniref:Putative transcriptional regulatory protein n=1 Tax=Penicillium chrysogenum TaxID=5076 RepID=A0A167Q4L0_PENCH|nr:putative transcriptional regulatory protein [Penicillium chrysogenum]